MSWSQARRPRTAQVRRERQLVLVRDSYRCQLRLPGCFITGDIDDHIVPLAEGGTDDLSNRHCVCSSCHEQKTREERRRGQQRRRDRALRPPVRHPGLID